MEKTNTTITWDVIKELHSKEQVEDLNTWLTGQTVPLDGVYVWDYELWRSNVR